MGSLFSAVECLSHSPTVKQQHPEQFWLPGLPSSALCSFCLSTLRHTYATRCSCSLAAVPPSYSYSVLCPLSTSATQSKSISLGHTPHTITLSRTHHTITLSRTHTSHHHTHGHTSHHHTLTLSHSHTITLTPQALPAALPLADRSMLPSGGKHERHAAGNQPPATGGLPAGPAERGRWGRSAGPAEGGRWD